MNTERQSSCIYKRLANVFKLFHYVVDEPRRPIFQPLPPLENSTQRGSRPVNMLKTYPNHNLFWFRASSEDWTVGFKTLFITCKLLTKFSQRILPTLRKQRCSNTGLQTSAFNSHASESYSTSIIAAVYTRLVIDKRVRQTLQMPQTGVFLMCGDSF